MKLPLFHPTANASFVSFALISLQKLVTADDDSFIDFPKEGDTHEHVFPPDLSKAKFSRGAPFGHLRPFGHQRKVITEMEKVEGEEITTKQIYMNTIYDEIPTKFTNYLDLSRYKNWTDEYMKEHHASVMVEGTQKVPGGHGITHIKHIRMEKFLNRYKNDDINLVMTLPEQLEKKTALVNFVKCGPVMPEVEEVKLWWSYGMTSSHIHADHEDTLLCLIDGRKDILMIDSEHEKLIGEKEEDLVMRWTRVMADPEHINMFTHNKLGRSSLKWTTLLAGDCMYVPQKRFHHIRSWGRAVAFSFHWKPILTNVPDFKDCAEPALNTVADLPSIHYRTDHRGKRVIDVDSYDTDLEKFRDEIFHLTNNRGYFERADFDRWWEQLTWHQTDKDYTNIAWWKIVKGPTERAADHRIKNLTENDLLALFNLVKKFKAHARNEDFKPHRYDEL